MKRTEFEEIIEKENLNVSRYNIDYAPMQDDEIGLLKQDGRYAVYQSDEHRNYHIINQFDSEEEALDKIYDSLQSRQYLHKKYLDKVQKKNTL